MSREEHPDNFYIQIWDLVEQSACLIFEVEAFGRLGDVHTTFRKTQHAYVHIVASSAHHK